MHTVYPSYVSNESHGLFAQTVNWLRNRNRLHCPQFSWVKAAAQESQAAKAINYAQASAYGFSPVKPPCRNQAPASPKEHGMRPPIDDDADAGARAASLEAGATTVLGGSSNSPEPNYDRGLCVFGFATADGKLPSLSDPTHYHSRQDPHSPLPTDIPGPQNSHGPYHEHSPQHFLSQRTRTHIQPRVRCRTVTDNPEIAQLSDDVGVDMDVGVGVTAAEIADANWSGATPVGSRAGAAHVRTRQSYMGPTPRLRTEMPYPGSYTAAAAPIPSQALCGRKHSHATPLQLPQAGSSAAVQGSAIAREAAAAAGAASLSRDPPSAASSTPIAAKGPSASGLSAAIRAANSLDELVALYDVQPEAFRSGHVSAALVRLPHAAGLRRTRTPRLREPRHEALLQQLLARFEIHRAAGEYGTRDLSSCAWVLGTLGRRDCGAVVSELAAHMLALRQQYLRQREAKATKVRVAAPEWVEGLRNEQSVALASKLGRGWKGDGQPSGEVSPLLMGTTTRCDATASPGAMPVAYGAYMPVIPVTAVAVPPGRASDCTPLDLSNMALGMAKAGVTSPHLWKALAAAAAAKKLRGFGTQETANFAWSLAQAHREFRRSEVGTGPNADRALEAVGAGADAGAGVAAGLSATDARRKDYIEDQWQGFVPWPGSCGGAVVAPGAARVLHPSWLPWARDFIEEILAPRVRCMLRFYTTQQAANAAWALAALGHADSRTLVAVAAIASASAEGSMRAATGQVAVATAVEERICAATGPAATSRMVMAAADRPAQKGQLLTPQGVCMFVWAMATMLSTMRSNGEGTAGISSTSSSSSGSTNTNSCCSSASTCTQADSIRVGSQRNSVEHITGFNATTHPDDTRHDKGPKQSISGSRYSLPPPPSSVPPLPDPPPEPPPLLPPRQTRPSTAIHPRALLALTRVAAANITRFSAQGLSNLMWGLGVLGFQSSRELRQLTAREALLRLAELKPLSVATLLEDWARARRHHPELFAAAAPMVTAKLYDGGCSPGSDIQPRTLARLLRAYGAVGHVNRRLFQAAAATLVPMRANALGHGGVGGTLQGTAVSAPLDELDPGELYQLVCAYGRVGVHAPQLMDEVLARLAPVLTAMSRGDGGGSGGSDIRPPPRAAGRLLCGLAVLGHRPAAIVMHGAHVDGVSTIAGATAVAAMTAFRVLRRSVLTGMCVMTSRHALAAIWALVRLRAAGAPEVLRLSQLLVRRAAPAADSLAVGLAAVARTPAVSGNPVLLTRFVWVLGRGAAAADADAKRLRATDTDAATAEAEAASAVFVELSGGLLAVAAALLGEEEEDKTDGMGAVTLHGDVLVALSEAIATILARKTRAGATADKDAAIPALQLYDRLYTCFLVLVGLALRRYGTSAAPQQSPGQLTARALADLVHAVYDSDVAATHPAMRVAAARQVLFRLQAVTLHNTGMATGPGIPAHRGRSYTRQSQWPHVQSRRHQQLPPKLSVEELAHLLAAAARMELFDHPRAQPTLREAARALMAQSAPSGIGIAIADDGGVAVGGQDPHNAPLIPVGLAALQKLIRHCWLPDDGNMENCANDASPSSGGGSDCSGRQPMSQDACLANISYGPNLRGSEAGTAAAMAAAISSGRTLRRTLYRWGTRQAQPLLPWLCPEIRALVLKASRADGAE